MRSFACALTAALTPMLLSVSAYAADGGGSFGNEPTGAGRLDAQLVPIKNALSDLAEVMEQVFAIMVSNPLLVVLLAASLFVLGIRIFRKVKGAAKG